MNAGQTRCCCGIGATARFAAPLWLALLLGACALPDPEPAAPPPAMPEMEQIETVPEAPPPPLPPPPPPDPQRLLGLEPRHIQDVLGAPGLVRREGAAQVMQFKNGNCVLDVIFYEETPGGSFRARHLASRLLDGAPIRLADCLVLILPDGRFPPGTLPAAVPLAAETSPSAAPDTAEETNKEFRPLFYP